MTPCPAQPPRLGRNERATNSSRAPFGIRPNATFTPGVQNGVRAESIVVTNFWDTGRNMRVGIKLTLIAAGYGLALAGGIAAVAVNETRISEDIQQSSGGMVAFGDMIVFVLATGFLGLAPSWFLLKLCVEKVPRTLIAAVLLLSAFGPASWLAVRWMATAGPNLQHLPWIVGGGLGLFIAFAAIPRIVFGPVLLMIEAATFLLMRERLARALLAGSMLLDLIPLGLFALHMGAAMSR